MASLQETTGKAISTTVRRIDGGFLSTTSLAGVPGKDVFSRSGMSAAGKVAPKRRAVAETKFDVAEARARISDFLDGTYRPRSFQDLMEYLKGRFLRIESRKQVNGQFVNYLVDIRSKVALMAADVDRRLSVTGIAKMFGRTVDAEAEARRRRLQNAPEMIDARTLRGDLTSMFHKQGLVPDSDWESFEVTMSSVTRGRVPMAQGGEAWVGFEVARAGDDPAENLRLMRRLQSEGKRCLWPAATVEEAKAGRLVPGMPIVLREGAVRTRMIDPERLSLQALGRKFGQSYFDYYASRPRRPSASAGPVAEGGNVLSLNMFRRRAEAPAVAQVDEAARASVRIRERDERKAASAARQAAAASRYVIRHELEVGGLERLVVVDTMDRSVRDLHDTDLPAGRYPKQDVFGMPDGSLVIDSEGGYSHRDQDGRCHNQYGPAVVPGPETGGRPRYAIRGDFMSARDFADRNSAPVAKLATRKPAPVVEDEAIESPGARFRR